MYIPNLHSPRQSNTASQRNQQTIQGFQQSRQANQMNQAMGLGQQSMGAAQAMQSMAQQQMRPAQSSPMNQLTALQQVRQSGSYLTQGPNNFGFQQQVQSPQDNAMQAAQQQAMAQRQQDVGQALSVMGNIYNQPQAAQMPSMQQSAASARMLVPPSMHQQQATKVRIPRQNPSPF